MKNTSLSFRLILVVSLVLACCALAQAQSGRRNVPSAPPPPVPTPTPEPTPKPKLDDEAKTPDIFFTIGAEQNSSTSYYPISYYEAVLRGCADALRKGSSAGIDVMTRDLGRGEAIKKAKADQHTYVVLLVLSSRTMSGAQNSNDVELEYTVFAPQTGKIATSGRSYQNANRAGPLIIGPSGTSSALYREKLLLLAGEDAGQRIAKALHLSSIPGNN